jgi:hypothetical protein
MRTPKTPVAPRKSTRTPQPTGGPAPAPAGPPASPAPVVADANNSFVADDGAPFDWFHVLACTAVYSETGNPALLAEALADAPMPPAGVLATIGATFRALLLEPVGRGRPKSRVAGSLPLCRAIAAAYRRELERTDGNPATKTRRERAADAVCKLPPFDRLKLSRDAVFHAVTAARAPVASKSRRQ